MKIGIFNDKVQPYIKIYSSFFFCLNLACCVLNRLWCKHDSRLLCALESQESHVTHFIVIFAFFRWVYNWIHSISKVFLYKLPLTYNHWKKIWLKILSKQTNEHRNFFLSVALWWERMMMYKECEDNTLKYQHNIAVCSHLCGTHRPLLF